VIAGRSGHNWLFCEYLGRVGNRPAYHRALEEWILRYPRRTGRDRDQLTSFEVFLVEDDSPPPGETAPRATRVRSLLTWPERRE